MTFLLFHISEIEFYMVLECCFVWDEILESRKIGFKMFL